MDGVIERRRRYLGLMRRLTLERGSFTIGDIQGAAEVPRSTAQDWVSRLLDEGCILLKDIAHGRQPARYLAASAVPSSACRRIFTTLDRDVVEIYHECLSGACAAFCGHHHRLAGGVVTAVERDGVLLRELARLGSAELEIGLFPLAAVGVVGVKHQGGFIIQHIRSIGGPAYSLTEMIAEAEGVCEVSVRNCGRVVEGTVKTRALVHLTLGVDDTDGRECGATFALAIALLQYLSRMEGVFPIAHHVAMLFPRVAQKTAGNSCSAIEVAVEPARVAQVIERALLFVGDESQSVEWGVAVREGIVVPPKLLAYGVQARREELTISTAREIALQYDVTLMGGRGVIGALAAVSLCGQSPGILLDPDAVIET
ncbi:MAG: sugar-specific transcriptional regulator TrmB [Methanomicrobiales archaeon]|jgi:hypothetical protein|nr:sugar-specific transcriptional regulator TrmB [Methanomicrobiales archaeon]